MTTTTAAWTGNTRSAAAACTISPTAETASAVTPSAPLPRSAAQSEQKRRQKREDLPQKPKQNRRYQVDKDHPKEMYWGRKEKAK